MDERKSGAVVVLRCAAGRFVYWHGLCIVDFIPNGRRSATHTWPVRRAEESEWGATGVAAKAVAGAPDFYGGAM